MEMRRGSGSKEKRGEDREKERIMTTEEMGEKIESDLERRIRGRRIE